MNSTQAAVGGLLMGLAVAPAVMYGTSRFDEHFDIYSTGPATPWGSPGAKERTQRARSWNRRMSAWSKRLLVVGSPILVVAAIIVFVL